MQRIVISRLTSSIYKDGLSFEGLNIFIPDGIKTLYFDGNSNGWIEYDTNPNQVITSLPSWTEAWLNKFEELKAQIHVW
jgi:hypothetical protein